MITSNDIDKKAAISTTGDASNYKHLPDSQIYLNKLENRLSKIKGSDKSLTSKNMLTVLQQAKDDYLNRLLCSSVERLTSLDDDADKEVAVSYIEKKLFPEKNGVTQEELQHLLESDVLEKVTAESNNMFLNESNIDR